MSALSIFKPPQEKPLSAADLLGAATKKAKSNNHLIYNGPEIEDAARWLVLGRQGDEIEREKALARDAILSVVTLWHEEQCAKRRTHESTVEINTPSGIVRISFQHRYGKLLLDRQSALQAAAGADFERFFKKSVSLKVKKEIAEDPERLNEMVLKLAQAMGPENFAVLFEVEQSWMPTKVFTETSCQLPAEARTALQAAGLKQVIAMAAK